MCRASALWLMRLAMSRGEPRDLAVLFGAAPHALPLHLGRGA